MSVGGVRRSEDWSGSVADDSIRSTVRMTLGRRTEVAVSRGRSTLLQAARFVDLPVLSSCEQGHCGSCMGRVLAGDVELLSNELLDADEIADGWVLACQTIPVSDTVEVCFDV